MSQARLQYAQPTRQLFSAKTSNCVSSIYFQTATYSNLCRRHLLINHQTPTLQKHKSLWLYYFPGQRRVTLRCPEDNAWTTRTELLHEPGPILNASACSIATEEFRTLPELHGSMQTALDTHCCYIPDSLYRFPLLFLNRAVFIYYTFMYQQIALKFALLKQHIKMIVLF